jgi:hypothetical protein
MRWDDEAENWRGRLVVRTPARATVLNEDIFDGFLDGLLQNLERRLKKKEFPGMTC